MESALKELSRNAFQAWTRRNRGRIMKAQRERERKILSLWLQPESWFAILTMAFALFRETEEMDDYAEEAAHDFELPEMIQAIFYAMLLNNAVGLGIVSDFIAANLRASLEGLRWTRDLLEAQLYQWPPQGAREPVNVQEESSGSSDPPPPSSDDEESSALRPNSLPEDYHGLCPGFDLGVYAHDSNISEMVQAIFYALVLSGTQNWSFRVGLIWTA
ncbi:hypothetical protein Cgig2_000389 [Carnegiea gigantea]|uniref:Uncharacterized protein n=1 Tax=Carnegiea gigantea TaxID=171969 RepID=A0A9Q1QEM9_9CARY|nr:hypothetical protein Cgig2_000389 [Carnegiea gigantea]